jgi:hypothetical protein
MVRLRQQTKQQVVNGGQSVGQGPVLGATSIFMEGDIAPEVQTL